MKLILYGLFDIIAISYNTITIVFDTIALLFNTIVIV